MRPRIVTVADDTLTVRPSGPLRGRVRVPGDKSITQRALLIGAVCDGSTEVHGPSWAGDPIATAGMLAELGVRVEGLDERAQTARVHGVGLRGLRAPGRPLDAHNSGTGLRLLAGLLAGQSGRFVLDGDASLRVRPMGRIVEPLRAMGVSVGARDDRFIPLEIEGGEVRSVAWRSPVASAQIKSCVLLAGLFAQGLTTVTEPAPSRDHTERMLRAAGAAVSVAPRAVEKGGPTVGVAGCERLELGRVDVPGDPSSAAFLVAGAVLVAGSELVVDDVCLNPTRLGFIEAVRRMGGRVVVHETGSGRGGEPRGSVQAAASSLHGIHLEAAAVPTLIDEVTLLALMAAFAEGDTVIEGVGDLRAKESDRLAAIVAIVHDLGGEAEHDADRLVVRAKPLRGGVVESRGDHRLALLGAIAGLACPDGVAVTGFAAADVSFPGFTATLAEVLRS